MSTRLRVPAPPGLFELFDHWIVMRRRFDNYLLIRAPDIWRLRPLYLLGVCAAGYAIAAILGAIVPVNIVSVPSIGEVQGYRVYVWLLLLVPLGYWCFRLLAFPLTAFTVRALIVAFGLQALAIFAIVNAPTVMVGPLAERIARVVSDSAFRSEYAFHEQNEFWSCSAPSSTEGRPILEGLLGDAYIDDYMCFRPDQCSADNPCTQVRSPSSRIIGSAQIIQSRLASIGAAKAYATGYPFVRRDAGAFAEAANFVDLGSIVFSVFVSLMLIGLFSYRLTPNESLPITWGWRSLRVRPHRVRSSRIGGAIAARWPIVWDTRALPATAFIFGATLVFVGLTMFLSDGNSAIGWTGTLGLLLSGVIVGIYQNANLAHLDSRSGFSIRYLLCVFPVMFSAIVVTIFILVRASTLQVRDTFYSSWSGVPAIIILFGLMFSSFMFATKVSGWRIGGILSVLSMLLFSTYFYVRITFSLNGQTWDAGYAAGLTAICLIAVVLGAIVRKRRLVVIGATAFLANIVPIDFASFSWWWTWASPGMQTPDVGRVFLYATASALICLSAIAAAWLVSGVLVRHYTEPASR